MDILIADDDAVARRLLEATLVRSGHHVISLCDGAEAVTALFDPAGPRLAILDWMMPSADGLEVCRRIRRRAVPYVYVILLTSRDRREDMFAALDAEVDDFLTKPFDSLELHARVRSGVRVLDLQERFLQTREALRHEATHDQLTGMWNRATVLELLDRELSRASRESKPLAVVIADIDRFKSVNDTHGHVVGDTVLRQAAARVRGVLREYESVGRYGGEEFLLVLPGCSLDTASRVAERVRAAVNAEPVRDGGLTVPVTLSLGVASTEGGNTQAGALVQAADHALYEAKTLGRNRVVVARNQVETP